MAGSCTEGQWLEKHQKRVGSLKQRMLQRERWRLRLGQESTNE